MSNKTPKRQPAATESAPKALKGETPSLNSQSDKPTRKWANFAANPRLKYIALGLVFLLTALLLVRYMSSDPRDKIVAPNGVIFIETADTPDSRRLGLSGRESIGSDEGLLFVFDSSSQDNCFWMKDMNFPIDMVFLNEEKLVVSVVIGATPDTYPRTFCPDEPAKYGLEIEAGRLNELGIEPGVELIF